MGLHLKPHSKIGCSLKQIFADIFAVYGSTNLSYDTVCRWKKKFDSELESIENAPKSGRPKSASYDKNVSEVLGIKYVVYTNGWHLTITSSLHSKE